MLDLLIQSIELGMITSITVLALYVSYSMLNICDLATDGVFTLGAAVGAVVALAGHPVLAIFAAVGSGMLAGALTAFLQTKLGINSLLSGIVVNTGLYSLNIAVMGSSSQINLNKSQTVFTFMKNLLADTPLSSYSKLIVIVLFVAIVGVIIVLFMKTRLGMALRATGDNPDMVRSSSINTTNITIIGLMLANAFTALSGCLLASYQKQANIDIGTGMLTIALASLLIGRLFFKKGGIALGVVGAVIGAVLFRIVYALALWLNMPAFLLKAVSSVIVIIAIAGPYLAKLMKDTSYRKSHRFGKGGRF